jgi:twinkle protein
LTNAINPKTTYIILWNIGRKSLTTSKFVRHTSCSNCGSSDGVGIYSDGHTYCYVCEHTTFPDNEERETKTISKDIKPIPHTFEALPERKISAETAKRYGVTATTGGHTYPYFNKDNIHVSNKHRTFPKEFSVEGDFGEAGLFGRQAFPAGSGKAITITEGELDAMSVYELFGKRYPAVSVKGASSAERDVANDFEYLNSFERVYICFDKDEAKVHPKTGEIRYPGQEAALAVAGMFPIGKAHIVTLRDHKDASDYLVAGKFDQFRDEWFKAPQYTPTGLKKGSTMWEEIKTPKNYEAVSYPYDGLNKQTYGIRLSELVVITADTGVGKTTLLKEIEHHILANTPKDRGVGLLHLEEPNSDTALGLMSISADKPLHLPDVREGVTEEELRNYYDLAVNTDRIVIWDHFGSNSIQEVLNKIRHMHNLGCKYIVLDHLSIVVSDQSGDERKQLDEITTKIKTLCMELNISVIAVIHQNRAGQIRGTAGVEQLANIVLKLNRNKTDPDEWRRNVISVVVEKNRFCGRTGPGCFLFYDEFSGRLRELSKEDADRYIQGQSSATAESW